MARKPKMKKIVGTFCEYQMAPYADFDSGSIRYKKSGKTWVMIGCPKGKWDPNKRWKFCRKVKGRRKCSWMVGKCGMGTKGYKRLTPLGKRKRCPKGSRRVTKE